MKTSIKNLLAVAGLLTATVASASPMYLVVGGNQTDVFNEFGYTGTLATSVYQIDANGQTTGSFYDTNIKSELTAAGIPTSGTAMDGVTQLNFTLPTPGQNTIDGLNPLKGFFGDNVAGYGTDWILTYSYHFDGNLTASGLNYTGGTFEMDLVTKNGVTTKLLEGILTGSELAPSNLYLFLDITWAETGFLWVQDENGNFVDASTQKTSLVLDTNVNPPIPQPNQLLNLGNGNAARQTTLDGSIAPRLAVPEPSTVALLGFGLFGLAGLARRRNAA